MAHPVDVLTSLRMRFAPFVELGYACWREWESGPEEAEPPLSEELARALIEFEKDLYAALKEVEAFFEEPPMKTGAAPSKKGNSTSRIAEA